jgi:hypothetical protein
MTGATAATCTSLVSSAEQANEPTACTTALQGYELSNGCSGGGAGGGLDAGFALGPDATIPCAITGACPAGSGADAGTPTTQCQPAGKCSSGTSYDLCVTTSPGGVCFAEVVFPDNTQIPCNSCTDCAAATLEATTHCAATSPPPVDAGPAVDCGSPPALHAEIEAGVYCPFTPAGSTHCGAGEECCESPSTSAGTSLCLAVGSVCPITGSLSWACDGPLDCAGGDAGATCCAAGTVSVDPACGFRRGSGFSGSHCAQACAAGELSLCDTTSDPCATGTCTAFNVAGNVLGTCE